MSYEGPGPVNTVLTGEGNSSTSKYAAASINIAGDSGTASGSTITLNANSNSGSSVDFVASASTVSLKVTDSNTNTIMGASAGNGSITGAGNTGYGVNVLNSLSSGIYNVGFGYNTLAKVTTGNANIGVNSFGNLTTGSDNVGLQGGLNYTGSESNNILIGNYGVISESNVMRLGTQGSGTGQQNTCYIAGITGVTVANPTIVTQNSATGQMGTIAYDEGTFTPTVVGATTAGTTTYSAQTGYYTIVGNLVTCIGTIVLTAATGTGNALIGGLPFTVKNQVQGATLGTFNITATWAWPASVTSLEVLALINSTTAIIPGNGSTLSAPGNLQMTNANATMRFTLTYQV